MTSPTRTRSVAGLSVIERAAARTDGEPLLVFVHGAMDRAASFARTTRHLTDCYCVRYDRRGYGHSVDAGTGDVDTHVGDLITVLDNRPAVVVGHSLGAVIGLAAAAELPDQVRAVVAFEPAKPWEAWWRSDSAGTQALADAGSAVADPGDVAERFMRAMLGEARWTRLPPNTRLQRRAEGPALVADLRSMRAAAPIRFGAIEAPAVVGYGSETSDRRQRGAREVAADLSGGDLHCISGAGHGAHLSHPAEFAALVRLVLERVDGAPGGRS